MYMLRTEIRKLGGLICFLFVMLAIQAQQYTVTGGNGVPYLLENPGNRIRVYLVYGMDNVEISYTSSSTNHQWYRYKQKALDREPVPCEQNGETSVVRNIEEDAGYYVEDPASGPVAENLFPDRPARRDDFYSELCTKRSRGKALVWTLEQGGNIVCTVGAYALCNGQAYMACGQTAEALRGQRVGGRLIVQMANALSAQGDQPVFLCSPERVHFYTQLGFHPLGTLARYESPIGKD